jgi:hypothetical protein
MPGAFLATIVTPAGQPFTPSALAAPGLLISSIVRESSEVIVEHRA